MKPESLNALPTFRVMRSSFRFSQTFVAAVLGAMFVSSGLVHAVEPFHFHHENILGTSLDLQVSTTDAGQATAAETSVLAEIERLRKILSSYDPESELSRLNAATAPMACSREMLNVLTSYDLWQSKSKGAYSGHISELAGLWSKAEKVGTAPSPAELQAVLTSLAAPGWQIDPATRSVTRLSPPQSLNLNSLGKGYIVTKAAIAARMAVPGVTGLLVNIGGDLSASGRPPDGSSWEIGVSDPKRSEDNTPPLTKLHLVDRAVSTSAVISPSWREPCPRR